MEVRCERCTAQYTLEDDGIPPAGRPVECASCGHVFVVKRTGVHPAGAAPAASRGEKPAWRVRQASGNVLGFRELTTLLRWIVERKVARDDEISAGGERWKPLGDIAELASFFQVVEEADRWRKQPAPAPSPAGPSAAVPVAAPPTVVAPLDAAAPPLPEHDIDLGWEIAPRSRRRRWPWAAAVAASAVIIAGAVVAPRLLAPTASRPVAPPPAAAPPAPAGPAPAAPTPAPPTAPASPAAEDRTPAPEPPPSPAPAAAPAPSAPPPSPAPPPDAAARPRPPPTPKALLERARKLLGSGDTRAALDLFGRVASQEPENVEALTGRALCYLDLELWAPAEESFRSALRADPDEPDALLGLAETYRFQGKKAEAIAQYERYLARHPDGDEAEVARNALHELRE